MGTELLEARGGLPELLGAAGDDNFLVNAETARTGAADGFFVVELGAGDDSLDFTPEALAELGNKLSGSTRTEVERVIGVLKGAMQADNSAEIKRLTETLTHASHRLAESAYQQSGPTPRQSDQADLGPGGSGNDEEVVVSPSTFDGNIFRSISSFDLKDKRNIRFCIDRRVC